MNRLTWKIWVLIAFLVFSLISILGVPPLFLESGVQITSVATNSTALNQGLRQGQIIHYIDGVEINDLSDFSTALSEKFNGVENTKMVFDTSEGEIIFFSTDYPEITVSEPQKSHLKLGLDLSGGARALVKAENHDLTSDELRDLIDTTNSRFNVYGIDDIQIRPVSDLQGNNFMLIEIAGATPNDLENLISNQGKFEAKIGNDTAFIGGDRDVSFVCRNDATCSGIRSCSQSSAGGYFCNFDFTIYLSDAAANRQANLTKDLDVEIGENGRYLSKQLDLYVDDVLLDSLYIGESLRGRVTTQIQISGSGQGATQNEALEDTTNSMKHLQTILITGSLPFKLEIVKLDTISPLLGNEFIKTIWIAGIAALLSVSLVVFARYRKIKPSLALIFTSLSEIIIILGIASIIGWNLDLPSIAGILVTVGTGIDQQIIIIDESRQKNVGLKQRMKRAYAIIMGAYFTALVAMLPLMWAGAGLLKGFAITTIIGITAGVLITRPAFSDMIKRIEE